MPTSECRNCRACNQVRQHRRNKSTRIKSVDEWREIHSDGESSNSGSDSPNESPERSSTTAPAKSYNGDNSPVVFKQLARFKIAKIAPQPSSLDSGDDASDEDDDDSLSSSYEESTDLRNLRRSNSKGKRLSFADEEGQDLVEFKVFNKHQPVADEFNDMIDENGEEAAADPEIKMEPLFDQPTFDVMTARLGEQKICLESANVEVKCPSAKSKNNAGDFSIFNFPTSASEAFSAIGNTATISGHVRVASEAVAAGQAKVLVRWTSDNWASFSDVAAKLAIPLSQKVVDYERYQFKIFVPSICRGQKIAFAIRVANNENEDNENWDNNNGNNYGFLCSENATSKSR